MDARHDRGYRTALVALIPAAGIQITRPASCRRRAPPEPQSLDLARPRNAVKPPPGYRFARATAGTAVPHAREARPCALPPACPQPATPRAATARPPSRPSASSAGPGRPFHPSGQSGTSRPGRPRAERRGSRTHGYVTPLPRAARRKAQPRVRHAMPRRGWERIVRRTRRPGRLCECRRARTVRW